MSEQKKTRADVIAEIQKTNDLLARLVALMERGQGVARNTRTTVIGGSSGAGSLTGAGGGGGTAG